MTITTTPGPYPCGVCWCPCGQTLTDPTKFFAAGHDKVAEAVAMQLNHGTVVQMVAALGYGPGRWPTLRCDKCSTRKPITKFPTGGRTAFVQTGHAPECRACREVRRQGQ